MKRRHIDFRLMALLLLVASALSGCGGTYVPANIAMGCYAKNIDGEPIPGLQASLIRWIGDETIQSTLTDASGYADFVIVHDEIATGRPASQVYADYKIVLVDPNGVYLTTVFQPRLASSDEDITVIIPKLR